MATSTSIVYLGFEDEGVTDQNKHLVDSTTNKIGGLPAWPNSEVTIPVCPICGLRRPLVLQIYAPLEHSKFHRTLYIFSCVNALCSNQSRGWLCLRVEQLDSSNVVHKDSRSAVPAVVAANKISWCSGSDDWGDADSHFAVPVVAGAGIAVLTETVYEDDVENANDEPNGNVMEKMDNRMSDEDEETNSLENDPIAVAFGNLQVDDKNANGGAQGGAVGSLNSPNASAELEGEESELVTIDVPTPPKRDLIAMLKQTTAVPIDQSKITLKSFFISVDVERTTSSSNMADHIRELLQEYHGQDEHKTSPTSPNSGAVGGMASMSNSENEEKYEQGVPIHGDLMFHNFVVTLQDNPGQIIRYSRDARPLLIAPLVEAGSKCLNCGGELICEVQILPTLISRLRFASSGDPAPIEFGNILVFTCQQSCWDTPDKMRLEHVVVQTEN